MTKPIASYPTSWNTVMLLCRKCARKMDGGYGPKSENTLRTALRAELKAAGCTRHVRLIEAGCMGIYPKKAVTALNASRPDRILIIPRGTPSGEALAQLGFGART